MQSVHAVSDNAFHNADNGCQGCERHENEEQRAPKQTAVHFIENVGQGDKNKAWTRARLNPERETGRENDDTCHEGDKGIQCADVQSFAGKRFFLIEVRAENHHAAHADAESEERLVHGVVNHIEKTRFLNFFKVRGEIKRQALLHARKGERMPCKNEENE